jgi:hypothetical protein
MLQTSTCKASGAIRPLNDLVSIWITLGLCVAVLVGQHFVVDAGCTRVKTFIQVPSRAKVAGMAETDPVCKMAGGVPFIRVWVHHPKRGQVLKWQCMHPRCSSNLHTRHLERHVSTLHHGHYNEFTATGKALTLPTNWRKMLRGDPAKPSDVSTQARAAHGCQLSTPAMQRAVDASAQRPAPASEQAPGNLEAAGHCALGIFGNEQTSVQLQIAQNSCASLADAPYGQVCIPQIRTWRAHWCGAWTMQVVVVQ